MLIKNSVYKLFAKFGAKIKLTQLKGTFINDSINVLDDISANSFIKDKLLQNQPFMVARFGHGEYECVRNYLELDYFKKQSLLKKLSLSYNGYSFQWKSDVKRAMVQIAGFFPGLDSNFEEYCKLTLTDTREVDFLGIWGHLNNEESFYKTYCPNSKLTKLMNLEPYYHHEPWSLALKGKKVLVIHPFEESIKFNYEKRNLIFPNGVLPDFELKTLKAVQSIAYTKSQFKDWFKALDYMRNRIDEIDYDVAIIGAGAYGFSLAAHIKRSGKQAIHLGGATQILFGIRGNRWDNMPLVASLYNEHWTRPLASEIPNGHEKIENGCYW